jgi:hypothetical protein
VKTRCVGLYCKRLPLKDSRRCADCTMRHMLREQRMLLRRKRNARIDQGIRNAVAIGFRKYSKLSAVAPKRAA